MNVVQLFQAQAEAQPNAPALIEGRGRHRRVTTFAELEAASSTGAARLRSLGLAPGDAVLLLVPLSADLYRVLASVFRAGLVAIVLDPSAGREHIARCCAMRPPDAFIGIPKAHLLRLMVPAVRRIPRQLVADGWAPGAKRFEKGADALAPVEVDAEAPALLTFTSGTTGQPKAAIRTHGILSAQHAALAAALELAPGQIDFATLPVVVLASLASGVTTVLPDTDLRQPGAFDTGPVLDQIRVEHPTRTAASPAFIERLLGAAASGDLNSFKRIDMGGAPVFPKLLNRVQATGSQAVGVYGSTEAEPIADLVAAHLSDADRQRIRAGEGLPVGRPVPHVEVRVITDQWGTPLGPFSSQQWDTLELAPGTVGEIVVAGDHVVPGYLNGIGDLETKVEVDGRRWHRTGDAGRLDADGRLWLLGRCASASRRLESVVYPLQVEAALSELTDARAAFLEVDEKRVVVVEGDGDLGAIQEAVAWADLDVIERVAQIPRDRRHNAKVDVPALRALLARSRV
ncbi:MAG: fatty acid CoA ligase family protein [Rubricoccaceae bacterium]